MFDAATYSARRAGLKKQIERGVALFLGNDDSPMNYPANTYQYRQDSSFLYYFGLSAPALAGVMDFESGEDIIFGNDVDIEDIIWMGPQPTMKSQAAKVGVETSRPYTELPDYLRQCQQQGRPIHFLPAYRPENQMKLGQWLGLNPTLIKQYASVPLIKEVVAQRAVKSAEEIVEIEKAIDITYEMQTTAMRMAIPGTIEREISGRIEGIALAHGSRVSFPIILTVRGETLHNHYHGNTLQKGHLMISDCGAESLLGYAGDITRTTPVGGKFDSRQKDIYEIVLAANLVTTVGVKPGEINRNLHLLAAETIASGLKNLGLMKGDVNAAVEAGAHALFFPHGLGHMMGLDVHDMEDLGENYVGYDDKVSRSDQFGLAYLRMGRNLQTGYVMTIEPGIYFIPALIDKWRGEGKHTDFINYDKVETYKGFGGVRLEDDVLVTENGYRVLGKPIPKEVDEVEAIAATGV